METASGTSTFDEEEDLRLLRFGAGLVAEHFGISERTLRRQFQRQGIRLCDQIRRRRRDLTLRLLGGDLPVHAVAARVGFSSPQAFARWVRRELGDTPTNLRRRLRSSEPCSGPGREGTRVS